MFIMLRTVTCIFFIVQTHCHKVELTTKLGKIIGTSEITVFDGRLYYAFYAIPYAKPPIENLRFKNPVPMKKWKHALDATIEYHGACAQPHIVHRYAQYGDENCLYLNIFTPTLDNDKSYLKSVVVWIHGYAFSSSFSHIYGPDFFIDNDVILVTLTHRIGVFGFIKLNDTDKHTNMGLKDIISALRWIKKHIQQFGGDKDNITVMGSGSGASFISLLLTTKYNKLFEKVILQSGSIFSLSLFQGDNKKETLKLQIQLRKQGITNIRKASTKDIIKVLQSLSNNKLNINTQQIFVPFLPSLTQNLNNILITNDLENYDRYISKIKKPILMGFNSQESITEIIPFIHNPQYLQTLAKQFKYIVPFKNKCNFNQTSLTYKQVSEEILTYYFKDGLSNKSLTNFLEYSTDIMVYPIYKFIHKYSKHEGNKMYVYKFNYNGNLNAIKANVIAGANIKVEGAASGDEICYLLKCEPTWESYVSAKKDNHGDVHFIKQITKLWTNFVKTGDPTPKTFKENVTWPLISLHNNSVLYLGKTIKIIDLKREKRMYKFWNNIYSKYYDHCYLRDEL